MQTNKGRAAEELAKTAAATAQRRAAEELTKSAATLTLPSKTRPLLPQRRAVVLASDDDTAIS